MSTGDTVTATRPLPDVIDAAAIVAALAGKRFPLENEKRLQVEMFEVLNEALGGFVFREMMLGELGIIDFAVVNHPGPGMTGIEVKIKGSAKRIERQLERYAAAAGLTALVLVTSKAVALPSRIGRTPLHVVNLGRAWL